jgi:hypothetical protein
LNLGPQMGSDRDEPCDARIVSSIEGRRSLHQVTTFLVVATVRNRARWTGSAGRARQPRPWDYTGVLADLFAGPAVLTRMATSRFAL